MAQTTTWKVNDMVRDDATGGVKTVPCCAARLR